MKNAPDEVFDQTQKVSILDFEEKYTDEILQIQAETNLSFWSKSDYLSQLERNDSIFKIAQNADGKIIGFALARLLIGDTNTSNDEFDSSEIFNIAVRQSFQKQAVGQMLFDAILLALKQKEIKEIWLEVRKSNLKAIAFYQKNDFKKQFERKNYYTDPPENALVFRRQIAF